MEQKETLGVILAEQWFRYKVIFQFIINYILWQISCKSGSTEPSKLYFYNQKYIKKK